MTTKAWTAPMKNSSAEDYKAWVSSFSEALTEVGFPKSADTGQLDIGAISSVPAAGTPSGYEVRYLDDSLHGTAPLYVKIEYGTGDAGCPGLWITAGTGSDGAGTLTGIWAGRKDCGFSAAPRNLVFTCYACATEGAAWIVFGESAISDDFTYGLSFVLLRTTDEAAEPTAVGAVMYSRIERAFGGSAIPIIPTTVRFSPWQVRGGVGASGNLFGSGGLYCVSSYLGGPTTTPSGDRQVVTHFAPFPEIRPVPQIASAYPIDSLASGTEFSTAIVGTTPRTYKIVHGLKSRQVETFALIWE